jgi:hypothetical protein
VERERFRQGLRSNPQGLALTGSHARLCSQFFWRKNWSCAGGSYPLFALLGIADRGIKPLNALSVYHTDDSSAARRREDHIPVLVRVPLYRGDHIHRHGYIPPQFLLIPNVRREHFDMSDSCAEAWGRKQWGGSRGHGLCFYSTSGRQKVKWWNCEMILCNQRAAF